MAVKNPEASFNALLKKVVEAVLREMFEYDSLEPVRAAQWFQVPVGEYMEWMEGETLPSRRHLVRITNQIRSRDKERRLPYRAVSDEVFNELFALRDEAETRARMREYQRYRARRQAEQREREERLARAKPTQLVPDILPDDPYRSRGVYFQPDPRKACTPEEFVQAMQDFREWAGGSEEFSARKLAIWSEGAFSHSTINKILSPSVPFDKKPVVKLSYVIGFIKACGGSPKDVAIWTTAWRSAYKRLPSYDSGFDEPPF